MLWNGLPLDMRQSPSLNVFKSKVKTMILIADLRNFYFVFIHGFLVKQVFIISLIVVVLIILVR